MQKARKNTIHEFVCVTWNHWNVVIPLVKEFASKSDEEDDSEEEEKGIEVDSEDKTDTTMPVNENRKTFIRR